MTAVNLYSATALKQVKNRQNGVLEKVGTFYGLVACAKEAHCTNGDLIFSLFIVIYAV